MKKFVGRIALAAAALAFAANTAAAQFIGVPNFFAPVGTGVNVSAMFGMGINSNAENEAGDKPMSVGGMVSVGMPMFFVGAGAGYADFSGDGAWKQFNFGGRAGFNLPVPPTMPVTVALVAGAGYAKDGDYNQLYIPAGATIGIKVPGSSVGITPWVSPQFRYFRASVGGESASNSNWGVSGGLKIDLKMFGFDISADYDGESKAFFGGAGVHVAFGS